jgi:two-component system phosphate regulon response regulator PhoB
VDTPPAALRAGDLEFLPGRREVRRGGQPVHLKPKEFDLLLFFAQHRGRVFSREQILDEVWGYDFAGGARTVDVHVGRLRKSLNEPDERDPIRTVRSAGYSFDETF